MLSSKMVVAAEGITVTDVRCRANRAAWSDIEPVTGLGVVLSRAGLFRRRVDGVESIVDPATGYVERPGSEQRIAHPGGGDRCTSLVLSPPLLDSIVDIDALFAADIDRAVLIDPQIDLAHRALVARARRGADKNELVERAIALAGDVVSSLAPRTVGGGIRAEAGRRRRLTDEIRQALHVDPRLSLSELARIASASPYHVSRTFREVCGVTISRYRARLRVRQALERLADGERNLAILAVDLGFADQAHLTRTVRAETGQTPGRLRAQLVPASHH